jgi:hypothetical protein
MSSLATPGFLLAQCLLVGIGVSLPLSSSIRYMVPLFTFALAYCQLKYAPYFSTSEFYQAALGSNAITAWLLGAKALWEMDMSDSFSKGFTVPLNSRAIGTSFEVKKLPKFPKYYGGTPSRTKYIIRESCFVAWLYLVIDLIVFSNHNESYEEKYEKFGNGQEYEFSMTKEKLAFRFVMASFSWFVGGRILLSGIVGAYQLALVVLLGGDPVDYPPMFGSMWEVWSVRQFWVSFNLNNSICVASLLLKTCMHICSLHELICI